MKSEKQQPRSSISPLLNDESSLLQLSSHLRGDNAVFESSIRGSSMEPSIPGLARVRVQLSADKSYCRGDIVYFQTSDGYMIHRVAWLVNRGQAAGFLFTLGDNCLLPDLPVPKQQVLGIVIGVEINKTWSLPVTPVRVPIIQLLIRTLSLMAIIGVARISVPLAGSLVAVLQASETRGRASLGGVLRRLGLRQ